MLDAGECCRSGGLDDAVAEDPGGDHHESQPRTGGARVALAHAWH